MYLDAVDKELSVLLALEGKVNEFQLANKESSTDAEKFARFLSLFKLAHSAADSSPVCCTDVLMFFNVRLRRLVSEFLRIGGA